MSTDPYASRLLRSAFAVAVASTAVLGLAFADGPTDASDPGLPDPGVGFPDDDPVTGHVLLRFAGLSDPDSRVLDRIAADPRVAGFERLLGKWPVYRVLGEPDIDPVALARRLQARPDVTWADADRFVQPHPDEPPIDDPMWDELWHLENVGFFSGSRPQADVHAVPAWEHSTGEGVIIAILDTGVDTDHPDLDVLPEGYDAYDRDGDPNPDLEKDDNPGHGTAVAGVAAAIGDNGIGVAGVAYGARIYGVRMLGLPGLTAGDMYNSIVAPVDAGADVLNNSWGSIDDECSPVASLPALNEAVEYARLEGRGGLGTVVVFSAGNSGCEVLVYPLQTQPGVISVGALRDDDVKFPYSVWGPLLDVMAPSGVGSRQGLRSTDIVGDLGLNGRGEDDEYTHRLGGTSGAAPVVSGVAALMIGANPRITEAEVRRVLCDTAVRVNPEVADYNSEGWSNTYGCGRVDAGAAVAAVVNEAPDAPSILRPTPEGDQRMGQVVLQWTEPADPDGEALRYEVEIVDLLGHEGDDDDDDDSAPEEDGVFRWFGLDDLRLDLSDVLFEGEYSAQVWAVDAWGRGPGSGEVSFFVVSPPPPPPPEEEEDDGDGCTCASASGASSSMLALGLLSALIRRRGGRGAS